MTKAVQPEICVRCHDSGHIAEGPKKGHSPCDRCGTEGPAMKLSERIEAAEAGSRALDGQIWYQVVGRRQETLKINPKKIPHYTTSLDAAMSLVLEGWETAIYLGGENANVQMETEDMRRTRIDFYPIDATAATPALALCAAAIKARGL